MKPGKVVLYFALRPPPAIADAALAQLCAVLPPDRLRAVAPTRLHVSLNPLGAFDRPPRWVAEAGLATARRIASRRFRVAFNRLSVWGRGEGPHPVVLWGEEGMIGIDSLHAALHDALAAPGLASGEARPIWPHMTLARSRARDADCIVPPLAWSVEEFVLIASHHGLSRHDILGRIPLQG